MRFKNFLFSDSFCPFLAQQKGASAEGSLRKVADGVRQGSRMAAIMLQTIPSFYAKLSEKSPFISAKTYEKNLVCKDYCIAHHDNKTFFYPFVNITVYYLEKLGNCYINWTHFVSPIDTWTVSIPCSNTDSAELLLQRVQMCLTMCKKQSPLTKETEEWTNCRNLQKRGS